MDLKKTSGGKGLNRCVESQCQQKKPSFNSWLKLLFKLCFLVFFCFALLYSSKPWLETFPMHKLHSYFINKTYNVEVSANNIYPKQKSIFPKNYNTTKTPIVPTQYHQAHPRNYHYTINNMDVCTNRTPFLVLMVPVAPSNYEARFAIRETWGNESLIQGQLVVTLFMLGLSGENDSEKLNQENIAHHDLIQSDFMDTYRNLTIKTLMIFDWLSTYCQKATFAMKIDSDMFLNVDNLVRMLQKPETPKLNYLTGMLALNGPVIRSKDSKWYVPVEMFPEPTYPPYVIGMGYIFSNDLPMKLVEVSKLIKPFYIEDVYVGMCMKKLGLTPTSPPDPSQFKAYATRYDRCECSKIITYILRSPQELKNFWTDLKRPGPYC